MRDRLPISFLALAAVLFTPSVIYAEDWPEWRGEGRRGVWTETDLLERFPEGGLDVTWRTPIHSGYAGPAVADGRVFVTDFEREEGNRGTERALALDEATGEILWTRSWRVDYRGLEPRYATGPRATPTVDGERVYILGAKGVLLALDVATGETVWQKDFVEDYGTEVPVWGMSGAPIVHGKRLIALVGGAEGAFLAAFDKASGQEIWRALPSGDDPGYGQPILTELGSREQLVVWHPEYLAGIDPATGEVLWQESVTANLGLTVATPVTDGEHVLVSSFFNGSMLVEARGGEAGSKVLWRGEATSEIDTDGLHALITTPMIDGKTIYGVCSYGQLRALDLETGERLWESVEAVKEKSRWAAAFLIRNGDRVFINNDRGELILARLDRKGYQEIDRTELIEPTSPASRRRERGAVHWSHPAYANRHVVVRNDREILRAFLGKPSEKPVPSPGD